MAATALTAQLERRFSGLERLYGVPGAAAIRSAHVAVVGIGGVGSWAAEALARSGVGRITLIDFDQVAESNINRQIHAEEGTLGMAKVDAMAQRIRRINPQCVVQQVEEFAKPDNWVGMVSGATPAFSAVIDACDQVASKTAMAAWARSNKASLYIAAGAAGGKRHAHLVDIADLSDTTHDPLLARLRYNLRKSHGAPLGNNHKNKRIGVACVFSREAVAQPDASCANEGDADGSLNCHGYGSVVSVTASFGLCAAGWVLDALAKRASP